MSGQRPDVRNIQPIVGPFTVREAKPPNADMGGVLDRGIVGRLADGTCVVIGEIWAACPDATHQKVSIDTDEMAQRVVTALNCHDDLLDALTEIEKGEGAFNHDPLLHAYNTVENMQRIARKAIAKATGQVTS